MKQVLVAAAILAVVACGVVAMLLGWRSVPGVLGEWLGMVVGVMSTPFFLEASFVVMGVFIVIVVNTIRRQREGDDFVSLDELDGRDQAQAGGKPPPPAPAAQAPTKP